MVQLGDERAKSFEKCDADSFEVGRSLVREILVMLVSGTGDILEISIKTHGLRIGGNLPLGRAKDDAYVAGVELQQARRNGIRFQRLIDGGENDDVVFCHLNDDATAGKIGDDFVFALLRLGQ